MKINNLSAYVSYHILFFSLSIISYRTYNNTVHDPLQSAIFTSERNVHLYLLYPYSDSYLAAVKLDVSVSIRSRSCWRSFCFKNCQQCCQCCPCRPLKYSTIVSDYGLRRPSRSVRIFFGFSDSHSRKGVRSVSSSLTSWSQKPILDMICFAANTNSVMFTLCLSVPFLLAWVNCRTVTFTNPTVLSRTRSTFPPPSRSVADKYPCYSKFEAVTCHRL